MISKISKGRGFGGVLAYVSRKDGALRIGGNVSENPRRAAREMEAARKYGRCRTPVWHCSLSLSPDDRKLSDEEFAEIADKFIKKMGLDKNQYAVYRHTDCSHSHIHIVANRICLTGRHETWNAWQDYKRAMEAKAELEILYKLKETPRNTQFGKPEITRGQLEEAKRQKTLPPKQYCAEAVVFASRSGSLRNFVELLRAQGIKPVPNIAHTGKMNGFSFVFGKKKYKGSQLKCNWAELSKRINFDPEADTPFLQALADGMTENTERRKAPQYEDSIYSAVEWRDLCGIRDSDYKRAYGTFEKGYGMKAAAREIKLHNPETSEKKLKDTLMKAGEYWIKKNRGRLKWAYAPRRRSIRFSDDPAIMLPEVLALLAETAVRAAFTFNGINNIKSIKRHNAELRSKNLSEELRETANIAESAARRRTKGMEQEREPEKERGPLLERLMDISGERMR